MFKRQFFNKLDGRSIGVLLDISRHTLLTNVKSKSLSCLFCRFCATSNFCSLNYLEQCSYYDKPSLVGMKLSCNRIFVWCLLLQCGFDIGC